MRTCSDVRVHCMCALIGAGFEASSQAWLSGAVHCLRALWHVRAPLPLRSSSPVQSGGGGVAGTVWLEERRERLLIVWRWTCSTHAGSGGGVVGRHCVPFGVDQAVLYYWHCLWTSVKISWRMGFIEEQDGAVASLPLNAHSTPEAEWEWLVIFYLFHVVPQSMLPLKGTVAQK